MLCQTFRSRPCATALGSSEKHWLLLLRDKEHSLTEDGQAVAHRLNARERAAIIIVLPTRV